MTPLQRRIVEEIRRDGPMPVDRYMALCLADPDHGYYMTRDPFGARGDFVTAPEMSQMFGEMIGVWIANAWAAMGRPAALRVIELGPGRGTLMKDALRAMRAMPELSDAVAVHLVEISPALRARQRETLAGAMAPIAWHDDLAAVPDGPFVVVANEFFDALPIRQFVRRGDGWRERRIAADARGGLIFEPSPDAEENVALDAPDGAVRERSPASTDVVRALSRRMTRDRGAALVIDYGYVADDAVGDTLQALRAHAYQSPLATPGEADLTAHVDFVALIAAAAGVATQGPVTQGAFLRAMGIATRARMLGARASVEQKLALAAALARLTDESAPTAMGALFKAIALRSPDLPPMAGFEGDASPP